MIVKKYSVKREKTTTLSKLYEIMKKNERYWSLVAQHEITAARITEKKINVVGLQYSLHVHLEACSTESNMMYINGRM